MEIKNILKLVWCCGSVLITEVTAINVTLKKNSLVPPLNNAIENVIQNWTFSFPALVMLLKIFSSCFGIFLKICCPF